MLKIQFPFIEEVKPEHGDGWYNVPADKIVEVCRVLRDEGFDCLSCLTATDRGGSLEVVYHLFSYYGVRSPPAKADEASGLFDVATKGPDPKTAVLKVKIPPASLGSGPPPAKADEDSGLFDATTKGPDPKKRGEGGFIPTVSAIWPSADWMEREAYDLVGINFLGHPNLKRILLPDDWPGHPLRKDYKEAAEYCGMTTTR